MGVIGREQRAARRDVASANDTAAVINAKLSAGLHVVLSPGIYKLDAPLQLYSTEWVLELQVEGTSSGCDDYDYVSLSLIHISEPTRPY